MQDNEEKIEENFDIPLVAVGTWMAARVAAMAWSSAEEVFFSSVLPALLLMFQSNDNWLKNLYALE